MPKHSARSPSITSQESYSAVIIADLVAEVRVPPDCEPVQKMRSPSLRSKEETNFGYDGRMDTDVSPSAGVKVDARETINKVKGPGISKGVILNAVHFAQPNSQLKPGSEKQIVQMTSSLPTQVPENKESLKDAPPPSGFSEMSFSRKVAFGVSFLPSILFVLCFAVILPCEKTPMCVQNKWTIEFNNSDLTSRLLLPQDIIFTLSKGDQTNITSVDESSGKVRWNQNVGPGIRFLDCGRIERNNSVDCIVQDENGIIHAINSSNYGVIWSRNFKENDTTSLPAILPDCNKDGIAEIALAVSNTKFKILLGGYKAFSMDILGCDSTPSKLIAWSRSKTTDLIYICQKEGNDVLFTIPQSQWCVGDKKIKEAVPLFSRSSSLNESLILPTQDGLALWVDDEVHMITENGTLWSASTLPHSNNNRFVLYGKFSNEGNQIALISSDLSTNLQVTTFSSTTGNATWSTAMQNTEISDITVIRGGKKDYALVLMKTEKKDLKREAVVHLTEVSTSVVNFLTKGEINGTKFNLPSSVLQEIALMPLDGSNRHTIVEEEVLYLQDSSQHLAASVASDSEEPKLKVFVANKEADPTTKLKRIDISNWDLSSGKNSKCTWN